MAILHHLACICIIILCTYILISSYLIITCTEALRVTVLRRLTYGLHCSHFGLGNVVVCLLCRMKSCRKGGWFMCIAIHPKGANPDISNPINRSGTVQKKS
ncbi:hypothetical protein F4779DRAFT_589643, partial [Xylariaceae sp. FL0662B]